ncbi:MAG: hypothetical protein BWY59_00554 [Verrucomicrobia bacterium ADurb.Bin345]|nr:MAG: hypothetical protein BWY59_00554 [Verrucomicrobia bacterium ADurb.Bin345]
MLISIGDRVLPGSYELHSRFARVANYTRGSRMVSLVTEAIGPGPTRIVVRSTRINSPPTLTVSRRTIALGPKRLRCAGIPQYASRLRPATPCNLAALERALVSHAPPHSLAYLLDDRRMPRAPGFHRALALHMRLATGRFLDALCEGPQRCMRGAVKQIAGCGYGLTPSGDDFLAGALLALRLLNAPASVGARIARAAKTGNALSNHFIELAAAGRAPEDVKQLATALSAGTPADVSRAARRVFALGETSGADLCTGLALTLRAFTRNEI